MVLKFYTTVTIELKLKVRKFLGLTFTFAEVARKKPVGSEIQHRRTARKLATLRDKEAITTIRRKA